MEHRGPSRRSRRIADLVQHQLAILFKSAVNDPRLASVSITSVVMNSDLSSAKVYFRVSNPDELRSILSVLKKATGYCRSLLADSVSLRYVPKLEFVYDEALVKAERLTRLLDQLDNKDAENE